VIADPRQVRGDLLRSEHEVDGAGVDCALRHSVVLGRARILGEGDSTLVLDRPHPNGPVCRRSREDDADGSVLVLDRERAKEVVDRQVPDLLLRPGLEVEHAALDEHVPVGRDDVDLIRQYLHALFGLGDVHLRDVGQNFGELAHVGRIEVLHEHKRHAGIFRQSLQQALERIQPAG
jgi:hypothetical protein